MAELPSSHNSLLVRTDFEDDAAWLELRAEVEEPGVEGFAANLEAVNDPAWESAHWSDLRDAVLTETPHAEVLFVVDTDALRPDYPVQVVDLSGDGRDPFRCVASDLWSVDANLNLANMDWEEFTDACDREGVFRGFD
ncbi:MAG: hypothetical protein LBU05_00830 [Bifidobacteriaceae bacterium]|nr:hypothetical protein [Bifidobacteriaceae bacterium]